jgi:hypothetical protein
MVMCTEFSSNSFMMAAPEKKQKHIHDGKCVFVIGPGLPNNREPYNVIFHPLTGLCLGEDFEVT